MTTWPEPGDDAELKKIVTQGKVDEVRENQTSVIENARRDADRTAATDDRGEDRAWKVADRTEDREWAGADRGEDRAWKVADRTEDREWAGADRGEDRAWKVADRTEDREWAGADRGEDRAWKVADRDADEDQALRKLAFETENDRAKVIHDARVEVAKGALARAHAAAEFIRNAAAGILAIYQGVIALRFAADHTTLPAAGVVPTLFLAIAVAGASAYLALLSQSASVPAPVPAASFKTYQDRRLNAFTEWISELVLGRAWALHMAVIALALGAIAIPAPFMDFPNFVVAIYALAGLALVALLPKWTAQR